MRKPRPREARGRVSGPPAAARRGLGAGRRALEPEFAGTRLTHRDWAGSPRRGPVRRPRPEPSPLGGEERSEGELLARVMDKSAGQKPGWPGGFPAFPGSPRFLGPVSKAVGPGWAGGGGGWWWQGSWPALCPRQPGSKQRLVPSCPALQSPVKGPCEPPLRSPEALLTLLHNYVFVGDGEGPRGWLSLRQTRSQLQGSGPSPPPGPGHPHFSVLPSPLGGTAPEQEAASWVTVMLGAVWGVCRTLYSLQSPLLSCVVARHWPPCLCGQPPAEPPLPAPRWRCSWTPVRTLRTRCAHTGPGRRPSSSTSFSTSMHRRYPPPHRHHVPGWAGLRRRPHQALEPPWEDLVASWARLRLLTGASLCSRRLAGLYTAP